MLGPEFIALGMLACFVFYMIGFGVGSSDLKLRFRIKDIKFTAHKKYSHWYVTNSRDPSIGMRTTGKDDWWEIGRSYEKRYTAEKIEYDAKYNGEDFGQQTEILAQVYSRSLLKAIKAQYEWFETQEEKLVDELLMKYLNGDKKKSK